jgi:long-subunit fatty acid transport protein
LYKESLKESSVQNNPYHSVSITQNVETTGSGVGGKFGFIIRPASFIRIGGAYHTPVRLSMTDNYENALSMRYSNGKTFTEPQLARKDFYEYQIVTPGRLHANAAIIIGKAFLFTADYERLDYRKGRLQATNDLADFMQANSNNQLLHTLAENYRTGIEFSYDFLRIRAGYAYLGSPFNEQYISKKDGSKQLISGGLGWVYDNSIFFDFAVSSLIGTDFHIPFSRNPETASIAGNRLNFMIGAGFKF